MKTVQWTKCITGLVLCVAAAHADDAIDSKEIVETTVPRIVLHDILTNRVCIFESKLYSLGAKVIILGKVHECTNANPMTFGASETQWDMRWVPVKKE